VKTLKLIFSGLLLSASMCFVALFTACEEKIPAPTAMTGWDRARWGMNVSEIQATYPATHSTRAGLELNSTTTIAEYDFIVQFVMDKSDRLRAVELRKTFDKDAHENQKLANIARDVAQDLADMNASTAYDTLKELLVQKYGRPTTEHSKDRDHVYRGSVWHVPNAQIHLSFFSASFPSQPATIFISYYKPGDTDKL
jgi:hypothetical protein